MRVRRKLALLSGIGLLLFILVGIAALTVPFDVHKAATLVYLSGDALLIRRGGQSIPLAASDAAGTTFSPGQAIRLNEGDTAQVVFGLNGGRVTVFGPAEFSLVQSFRRATAQDHARGRAHYVLTLDQRSGTARYDFSGTDPAFPTVAVTVRLPHETYSPDSPCWEIVVAPNGSAQSRTIDCP